MSAPRSLRGQDLRARDLSAVRLTGADLRAVDLREADLRGLDFSGADLRDARLDGAHLQGALLRDCELGGASLEGADLRAVDLRRSTGFGLKANWARMEEARLDGAEWRFAELRGAVLDRARGTGMRLDRADLLGASLQEAWLPGLVLDDAILEEADLRGAYLRRAALVGVAGNFRATGADLRRADLLGVSADCLEGAKLQGARRQGVLKRLLIGGEELQKIYRIWMEERQQMADLERARLEEQQRRIEEERRLEEEKKAELRRLEEQHRNEQRRLEAAGQAEKALLQVSEASSDLQPVEERRAPDGNYRLETPRLDEQSLPVAPAPPQPPSSSDLPDAAPPPLPPEVQALPSAPVQADFPPLSAEAPSAPLAEPSPHEESGKPDVPADGPVWTERLKGAWSFIRGEAPNPDSELRLELRQVAVRQESREREGVLVPGEALPEVTHRIEQEALEEQDVRLRAQVRTLLVGGHNWQVVEAPDLEGRLWIRKSPKEEPAKIPERALRPPPPPDATLDAQARLELRRYLTSQVEASPVVPESLGVAEPGTEAEPVEVPKPAEERPEAIPAAVLIPAGPEAIGADADARALLRRELAKQQSAESASERARLAAAAMEEQARRLREDREQAILKAQEDQEKQRIAAEERAQQLAEERARAARERARLAAEARQIAEARLEAARKAAEKAAQAFRALMATDPAEAKVEPPVPELEVPSIETEAGRVEVRRRLALAEQKQRREATAELERQRRNADALQDLQRRQVEAEELAQREAELRVQAEALAEQRRQEEIEAQALLEQQRVQAEEARRERERLAFEARILAEQKRRQTEADMAERESLEFEVQQSREVRRSADERSRSLDAEAERFLAEVVRDIRTKAAEDKKRQDAELLRQRAEERRQRQEAERRELAEAAQKTLDERRHRENIARAGNVPVPPLSADADQLARRTVRQGWQEEEKVDQRRLAELRRLELEERPAEEGLDADARRALREQQLEKSEPAWKVDVGTPAPPDDADLVVRRAVREELRREEREAERVRREAEAKGIPAPGEGLDAEARRALRQRTTEEEPAPVWKVDVGAPALPVDADLVARRAVREELRREEREAERVRREAEAKGIPAPGEGLDAEARRAMRENIAPPEEQSHRESERQRLETDARIALTRQEDIDELARRAIRQGQEGDARDQQAHLNQQAREAARQRQQREADMALRERALTQTEAPFSPDLQARAEVARAEKKRGQEEERRRQDERIKQHQQAEILRQSSVAPSAEPDLQARMFAAKAERQRREEIAAKYRNLSELHRQIPAHTQLGLDMRVRLQRAQMTEQALLEGKTRKQQLEQFLKEANAPVLPPGEISARLWTARHRKSESDAKVQAARREERLRQQAAMAEFRAKEQEARQLARAEKQAERQKVLDQRRREEERQREAWETHERNQRLERYREQALQDAGVVDDKRLSFRQLQLQAEVEAPFESRLQVRGPLAAARRQQRWQQQIAPAQKVIQAGRAAGAARLQLARRSAARSLRTTIEFLWANPSDGPGVEDRIEFQVEVNQRINQLLRQQDRQDDSSRLATAQHNENQRRLRQQLLLLSPGNSALDPRQQLRQEQVAEIRRKRRELLYQRIGSGLRRSVRTVASSVPGGVNFVRARLARPALPEMGPGADLRGLHLEDADLRSIDLEGAQLERASLVGADLRGANLRGANLRDADLSEARLSGADLRGADLTSAVLDQAILDGALLEDAILEGALLDTARGLDPALRRARGASSEQEERWARATSYLTVGSLAAAVVLYLGVNWQNQTVDLGDLEQAAGEAQRVGNTEEAASNFEKLASHQDLPDSKINYLLEAAASAEESKDYAKVLSLLEEAIAASEGGAMETTVRLRLARAQARGNLTTAAENSYRLLLARIDLEPVQQAEALVGLASVVDADKLPEIKALQKELLKRSATDLERGSVALALADGWSSTGHPDDAQAVVESVLSDISDSNERATLRLRLGRLMVENGDSDGALALYRQLISGEGTSGLDARLGAAELLMKRGDLTGAGELLGPLLEGSDDDRRARALIVSAAIAGASDDSTGAVAKLQEVLAIDGISNQRQDEARLALGRLLVRTDPEAAAAFAANNPMLKEEMLLGQARALRESGDRRKARELWVQLSDDPTTSEEARTESQLALSDLQLEEGDADGALSRYQQLLEVTTTASLRQRVMLGMADALLKLGKLQEAETKYDGLIPVSSPEVALRCQLGLARAAEMRGQLEKASRLYLQVSQEDGPGALEALLSLGELRERNGDLAGAVEALRLARTRVGAETERRTEVDIALARVLQIQGSPEAATLYAQLLEAPDPNVRVQARLAVGEQRLATEPEAALKLFDEAESQATRPEERADARAGWMRAMVLLGKGDEAVERARAWLAAENDSARKGELALAAVKALRAEGKAEEASALGERYREAGGFELAMELAGVYQDRGDLDASIRALQGAVAKEPEDKVWQAESLLDSLLLAGRWTEADAVCTRLSALPGGDAPARFGRARVLREQGKLEESLAMLADLDDPRVPMERAELLQALGRDDESEVLFRRMLLSNDAEQRTAGRVGLARILLERGDAAAALETLEGEAVTEGYALTAAEVRGEAFLALNKVTEAQAVYSALDGDAEARVVRALGLGDCALAAENPVAARGYFEQALGSVDRFYQAQALAGLVRTAAEAGDPAKAGELLQKLRREYPDHEDAIVSAQAGIGGQ